MDSEAPDVQKTRLESELREIEAYKAHPLTQMLWKDTLEQQETLLNQILEVPVVDIQTFLLREQSLGHLRGLRRNWALIEERLDEVKETLKNEHVS